MNKVTITGFGEIDINNPEEFYDTKMDVNGREVEVDIIFEAVVIDRSKADKINEWLLNLSSLDQLGLAAMAKDFKTGEIVKEYIDYHLGEFESNDIERLIQGINGEISTEERMLTAIKLKRIGFYPNTKERFVSLDYSFNEALTDYLIVLDFTEEGQLHYITMES